MRFRLKDGFDLYRKPSISDVLNPDISHWRREVLMYRRRRMDLESTAKRQALLSFPHLGCGPWAWTAQMHRLDAKIQRQEDE
jgi:hypothetical protein